MNVEEALKDAMAAQVAGVHASPSLGQAVRRRSRRHVVRFRTAGAAVLTAAVAVGVPVALTARPGAVPAAGSAHGSAAGSAAGTGATGPAAPAGAETAPGDTVAVPGGVVPDVLGRSAGQVQALLKEAGYTVRVTKVVTEDNPPGTVIAQVPPPGTVAPTGSAVTITIATTAAPTPAATTGTEDPRLPQDLGDLGDGRAFGGVHVGYLPEGLEWGRWSGKDGFGRRSYTTSWVEPGLEPGMYSVQMVLYRKEAAALFARRMQGYAAQDAKPIEVGGRKAYLVSLSEGADKIMDGGTRTLVWTLASGVGAEVMISPDYAAKLGDAAADKELKKIAAGVVLDK